MAGFAVSGHAAKQTSASLGMLKMRGSPIRCVAGFASGQLSDGTGSRHPSTSLTAQPLPSGGSGAAGMAGKSPGCGSLADGWTILIVIMIKRTQTAAVTIVMRVKVSPARDPKALEPPAP